MAAAVLAAAAAALGTVHAQRVGVREVATAALALICLTPLLGAGFVRLRYGATGKRTFHQQIAANRGQLDHCSSRSCSRSSRSPGSSSAPRSGCSSAQPVLAGLVFAAISRRSSPAGATLFALRRGDAFILDLSKASKAGTSGREQQLRNVVAEMATAANLPAPRGVRHRGRGAERVRRRARLDPRLDRRHPRPARPARPRGAPGRRRPRDGPRGEPRLAPRAAGRAAWSARSCS